VETSVPRLRDCLDAFNRKERNLLLRDALGDLKKRLVISNQYLKRVWDECEFTGPRPAAQDFGWWTDYHFDWIIGAVAAYYKPHLIRSALEAKKHAPFDLNSLLENPSAGQYDALIQGSQEDADLLLCSNRTVIIIEAKGYTSFSGAQLERKLRRVDALKKFAEETRSLVGSPASLRFKLVITAPRRPRHLDELLSREKVGFIEMKGHNLTRKLRVTRCDDGGRRSKSGAHWKIYRARMFDSLDREAVDPADTIIHDRNKNGSSSSKTANPGADRVARRKR
jgi:hypothetical protein